MRIAIAFALISLAAMAFTVAQNNESARLRPVPYLVTDTVSEPQVSPPVMIPPTVQMVPMPMPVYRDPDALQSRVLQWIGVATAVITALSAFVAFVITKLGEIKRALQAQREELGGRQDRQNQTTAAIAKQVNAIALATPGGKDAIAALAATASGESHLNAPTGLVGLAIACLGAALFMGCATDTGNTGADARGRATNQALREAGKVLGNVAVSTLFNVATSELSGNKADFGSAAASGLWANVNAADSGAAVKRIVDAYSAGNAKNTATAAKNVFESVAQSALTPATLNAIAAVISSAAGAPPKS